MKRKYGYGAILAVVFWINLIDSWLVRLLGDSSVLSLFLLAFFAQLQAYLIAAGMIRGRSKTQRDYFAMFKTLSGKRVLMLVLMAVLQGVLVFVPAVLLAVIIPTLVESDAFFVFYAVIYLLVTAYLAYSGFVIADPRHADASVGTLLKQIFTAGGKLFGKSLIPFGLKFLLPLVVSGYALGYLLGIVALSSGATDILMYSETFATVYGGLFVTFITPVILRDLANYYLDYVGDWTAPTAAPAE